MNNIDQPVLVSLGELAGKVGMSAPALLAWVRGHQVGARTAAGTYVTEQSAELLVERVMKFREVWYAENWEERYRGPKSAHRLNVIRVLLQCLSGGPRRVDEVARKVVAETGCSVVLYRQVCRQLGVAKYAFAKGREEGVVRVLGPLWMLEVPTR